MLLLSTLPMFTRNGMAVEPTLSPGAPTFLSKTLLPLYCSTWCVCRGVLFTTSNFPLFLVSSAAVLRQQPRQPLVPSPAPLGQEDVAGGDITEMGREGEDDPRLEFQVLSFHRRQNGWNGRRRLRRDTTQKTRDSSSDGGKGRKASAGWMGDGELL